MKRLIKQRLRNAEGINTSRRMYDPSKVIGIKDGKVLLKSDYLTKSLIQVGNALEDSELIYIDLDKIDFTKLNKMTYKATMIDFYIVAKFSLSSTTKYTFGYLTISADKKPYIMYSTSEEQYLYNAKGCGEFTSNKYGTYAMFKQNYGRNFVLAVYVDLYHVEKMKKVAPGVELTESTKIYFDTRLASEDASIFATDNYIVGWDAVNQQAVCGTTILETTLDGFVAIFSAPTTDIVTETYLLSFYEEA